MGILKNGDIVNYKNKSIWLEPEKKVNYPKLYLDKDVDVLIIGGGITGISVAYHLIDSGLNVCLVEKNEIGLGVTSKTTGKLTYLQEKIYSKLKLYHGISKTKLYLTSQIDAINMVKNIVEKEQIDCDFSEVRSYIFSTQNDNSIKKEVNLLKKLNIDLKEDQGLPTDKKIPQSFYVEDTYVFHPIKYIYTLSEICKGKGIYIYENTKILSIDKEDDFYLCKTEKNSIITKYIILAMHYPYFLIPFWMPVKSYIEKSYIEAFEVDKDYNFSAISISKPTISIRYHISDKKNYQLYLTNSHNLCIKNDESANFNKLLKEKNNQPDYLWSNKDIMTNDALPFIGSIDNSNTFLIGTGYNTWGMTNGSLAGKVLSDIILGKENKYVELFKPKRKMNIGKIISFPLILSSNAYSFVKTKLKYKKSWYHTNVRFEVRNGKRVGIYVDEDKKEHIVYILCPHMKCNLIFNEVEKTWDCPCHGSRFDIDGNSIEGPSNYNITYRK